MGLAGGLCTIGIAFYLNVDIPGTQLFAAQLGAARMFREAGVALVWRDRFPQPNDKRHAVELTLIVLPDAIPGTGTTKRRALGLAAGGDGRGVAYVFFDRVSQVAREFGVSLPDVLALALAHELGHLLLSAGSHSSSGIMQGGWDRDTLRDLHRGLSFTASQAQLIRSRCR